MSNLTNFEQNTRNTRSSVLKPDLVGLKKARRSTNSVKRKTSATSNVKDQTAESWSPGLDGPAKKLMCTLTRRECFSAAHRLHNSELTETENRRLYGKCNNEHGHGHNYEVKVTLRGSIDPKTGMLYNLADLKSDIRSVLDELDHKNLDKDVFFFKNCVSSVENIALAIHAALRSQLAKPQLLYKVKVKETENNSAAVIST